MAKKQSIMEGLKKVWNLKDEGKKDSSYSNVPIDHPDVESIRKIDEKDSGLEYNEKEKQMEALGIESDKMYKSRRKAKRFVDLAQGNMARKRTATEGSFKKGGLVKQGKPKLAKKGWRIMLKKIKKKICEIICKVFKITPCVCDHECNCKKENK
jgi:hypothetical protein